MKINKFVQKAIDIANDNSHGYSQIDRWNKDFDCSSLVYLCGYYAGYNLPTTGTRYTGTIIEHFSACGFKVEKFDGNLNNLEKGDILLNVQNHVAIYIGNGKIVEASQDELGGIGYGALSGDQTGREIRIGLVYNYPWTHILTPPKEKTTGTWKKNNVGWWYEYDDGAWASNEWLKINGIWYWFKASGYMAENEFLKIKNKWYAFNKSGAMIEKITKLSISKNGDITIG